MKSQKGSRLKSKTDCNNITCGKSLPVNSLDDAQIKGMTSKCNSRINFDTFKKNFNYEKS